MLQKYWRSAVLKPTPHRGLNQLTLFQGCKLLGIESRELDYLFNRLPGRKHLLCDSGLAFGKTGFMSFRLTFGKTGRKPLLSRVLNRVPVIVLVHHIAFVLVPLLPRVRRYPRRLEQPFEHPLPQLRRPTLQARHIHFSTIPLRSVTSLLYAPTSKYRNSSLEFIISRVSSSRRR